MAKDKKSGDYEVGYCRPPVHSRFKKGQSGHPGGRRKGSTNVQTDLDEVLNQEIIIHEGGKRRKVTVRKALLLRQVQDGLKGNNRAIDSVLDRAERYESIAGGVEEDDFPEEDKVILERRLCRLKDRQAAGRVHRSDRRSKGGADA